MKSVERNMMQFFNKYRLLDGYIGILFLVLHYKILAVYSSWFYIFSLSLRNIFYIALSYHPRPCKYPPIQFQLELFKKTIFDNGKQAATDIHNEVNEYLDKRKEEKEQAKKELATLLPDDKQNLLKAIE